MSPEEFRKLHREFEAVLSKAQKERDKRAPEGPGGWIMFERLAMFDYVNLYRCSQGAPIIAIKQVEQVETVACGHVDYATKFALYCTELAVHGKTFGP